MLDLRQLRYFAVVAEEEHIGRAAARLHVSPSPLSRQIARLEESLGLPLFERSRQRLRLTSEGRAFLDTTRDLLAQAQRLEALGKRLASGDEGGLHIGHTEQAMHCGILPLALRALRERRPGARLALSGLSAEEQLERLRRHELDLALVGAPPDPDEQALACAKLSSDPVLLAMARADPLCGADIGPAELQRQSWIAVRRPDAQQEHEAFLCACVRAGFTPDVRMEAGDPLTALGLVAAGLGVAMAPRALRPQAPPGVVLRAVPCLGYRSQLWMVWQRACPRALVTQFRACLLAAAAMGQAQEGERLPASHA